MPAVMFAPDTCSVAPPPLMVMTERKVRCWVDAATVSTHGPLWLTVAAPGPSLPAEAETSTPAA
jgi:hypothetical protein